MRLALLIVLISFTACSSAPAGNDERADALNAARRKASVQLEAGEYGAAVKTLEPLSRETPRDDRVWVMLGDAQRGLKQFEPAVKSYEQAIRINYGAYLPHLKLGTWLMENGKTGRALTEFEVAVKYGNDDPLTHYNYGLALREMGRPGEALTQWRVARDLAPENAEVVEAVGIGLSGVEDKAAVACFEQAEQLGRTGASFSNNFALALERTGQQERAREYFAAAVAADSSREDYARNLALHDMRVGDIALAEPELASLVERFGARWSYCVYLARARVELGRFDAALDALQPFRADLDAGRLPAVGGRVDRVPPTLAEALSSEGLAWRGKKDLARARAALERAATLAPRDPSILINYGVVLAEGGMLPEARAQWKRVLELDPGNTTARANLSAYER